MIYPPACRTITQAPQRGPERTVGKQPCQTESAQQFLPAPVQQRQQPRLGVRTYAVHIYSGILKPETCRFYQKTLSPTPHRQIQPPPGPTDACFAATHVNIETRGLLEDHIWLVVLRLQTSIKRLSFSIFLATPASVNSCTQQNRLQLHTQNLGHQ